MMIVSTFMLLTADIITNTRSEIRTHFASSYLGDLMSESPSLKTVFLMLGYNTTHEITHQISRKLLRMDALTSETCSAVNNEIIKQVTSSWSLFIQISR